jgi:hypothetical protein
VSTSQSRVLRLLSYYGIYHEIEPGTLEWLYLCPFHDDHNVGSSKFNDVKEAFYCFSCGEGGSIYEFVARMEQCSYDDAKALLDSDFSKPGDHNIEVTQRITNRFIPNGITSLQYGLLAEKAVLRLLHASIDHKVSVLALQQCIACCVWISNFDTNNLGQRYKDALEVYAALFQQLGESGGEVYDRQ